MFWLHVHKVVIAVKDVGSSVVRLWVEASNFYLYVAFNRYSIRMTQN